MAHARDDRELELADFDARIADRAEQHRVHVADAIERRVRHRLAGREEVVGAVGHPLALRLESVDFLRGVEDAQRGGDDFLADAVAGEDADVVDLAHRDVAGKRTARRRVWGAVGGEEYGDRPVGAKGRNEPEPP